MLLSAKSIFYVIIALLLSSCASSFLRLPASLRSNYDQEKVRLLSEVAKNGILFQFDEDFLKDIPRAHVMDNCQITDEELWGEQFFSTLKALDRNPQLYKKFHVLQFKRGDSPGIEITQEWDGGIYLTLTYQKIQKREPMSDDWKRRCQTFGDQRDYIVLTQMDWPSSKDMIAQLRKQADRNLVPRFNFNTAILTFLAERVAIFRLNPPLAGEKSLQGQHILPEAMNKLSAQVGQGPFSYIDYWLQEINQKSRLGKQIKFFTVLQDHKLSRGMALDGSGGGIAASLNQSLASTYLYVSYRARGGEYQYTSLQELDLCLKSFNPYMSNTYSSRSDRFLSPGFTCEGEQ